MGLEGFSGCLCGVVIVVGNELPVLRLGIVRQPENVFKCCFSFAETRFARFQAAFCGAG